MTNEQKHEFYKQLIKWIVIGVICIVALILFKPSLMGLIDRTKEVKVSKGDIEVVIKAGINLAQAEAKRSGGALSDSEVSQIAKDANKIDIKYLHEKTILWVDDNPGNNTYEINAFRQL
jgi:hypothetical protein